MNFDSESMLSKLPVELWVLIFSLLDPVYLHVIKFVCREFKELSGKPLNNPLLQAIKEQNNEMVQWCINQRFIVTQEELIEVAKQGDLENLEKFMKLLELGQEILNDNQNIFLNQIREHKICSTAAQYGHLHILEHYGSLYPNIWQNKSIQEIASLHGHLHILEHIYELNREYLHMYYILKKAIDGCHLHIYRWVCKHTNVPIQVTDIYELGKKGDFEFIKEIGPDKIKGILIGSPITQHLEIMKWMHENNILSKNWYAMIATRGNLEVLKWFQSMGYELDKNEVDNVIKEATINGHLDILKWLDESFEITLHISYDCLVEKALIYGHMDILRWADERYGCQSNFYISGFVDCPLHLSLELLNWMDGKKIKLNWQAYIVAIEDNDMINLQWLYDHGCSFSGREYDHAIDKGFLHIVIWLKNHGLPFNLEAIALKAANRGHLYILEWVKEAAKESKTQLPESIMCEAKKASHLHILKWGILNGLTNPKIFL